MSLNLGTMYAQVALDDSNYRNKLGALENQSNQTFQKIASLAGAYLSARAISGFVAESIKAYSDLEEATNKFDVVFAGLTQKSAKYIEELKKNYGQSDFSAKTLLSGTGDILTGFGMSKNVSLELSNYAAQLGSDLASFSNYAGGAKGATEALTKAMLGETEMAKMLGIVIRQDDETYKSFIKQAMTTGVEINNSGKKIIATTEQQAKAITTLALAYQQSPNAIGDFMRTQDSLANQSKILANNYKALQQKIGAEFANSGAMSIKTLNELIIATNKLDSGTLQMIATAGVMTGAFVLLAKTGMLANANNLLNTAKFGVTAKLEAQATVTSENLKRAEYTKTQAFREAHAKADELRIARMKTLEAQSTVNQISNAGPLNNQGKIQLATASRNLTQAQIAETKATQALTTSHNAARVTAIQWKTATKASKLATDALATSTTLAGKAKIIYTGIVAKTKMALTSLAAAIGPVGGAMIALGVAYLFYQKRMAENQAYYEGELNASRKRLQLANDQLQANDKLRNSERQSLSQLLELSQHETLSNSSKEQTKKILDSLIKKYGDLGIEIDSVTGKVKIGTEAWNKFNEAQAKQKRKDLTNQANAMSEHNSNQLNMLRDGMGSLLRDSLINQKITDLSSWISKKTGLGDVGKIEETRFTSTQNQIDKIAGLKTQDQINALTKLSNSDDVSNEQSKKIKDFIERLKKELELRKKLSEFSKKGNVKEPTPAEKLKQAEADQNALTSLADKRWQNQYNDSDDSEKMSMLDKKLSELNQKKSELINSGTKETEMTVEQLKLIQQIEEVERRRKELKEANKNTTDKENDAYSSMLANRKKILSERKLDDKISNLKNKGKIEEANALIQEQINEARKASITLQNQYNELKTNADVDGKRTDEESEALANARQAVEKSFASIDRWENHLEAQAKDKKASFDSVGSFSARAMSNMLGNGTAERTAKATETIVKNTKKTVDTLKKWGVTSKVNWSD